MKFFKKLRRTDRLAGLILAKKESGRLPNKNTLDFHGEPMFLVNVKKCLKIFKEVYVSSDSDEILNLAKFVGAIPIKRGELLCGDTPNMLVYRHALEFMPQEIVGIVAVQANSPTVSPETIEIVKRLMEEKKEEVMTCHLDRKLYGSVWGLTRERIKNYKDFYKPKPEVTLIDLSIDIHTYKDYKEALKEYEKDINNC